MRNAPTIYYRLGESSGLTATDSSGNGNNGTYAASGVTYGVASSLRDGSTNTAVTFSGVGQVNAPVGIVVSGNVTIMVWFKTAGISGNTSLFANYTATGPSVFGLGIAGSATNLVAFIVANMSATTTATPTFTVTSNVWCHLAATFDTTSHVLALYANGALVGTNTESAYSPAAAGFFIGDSVFGDNQAGSYDEAVVYSKVLTANQINAYYQSTNVEYRSIKQHKRGTV